MNLVHILSHLVSFNIVLAIFSRCLHQKYGFQVGLVELVRIAPSAILWVG